MGLGAYASLFLLIRKREQFRPSIHCAWMVGEAAPLTAAPGVVKSRGAEEMGEKAFQADPVGAARPLGVCPERPGTVR